MKTKNPLVTILIPTYNRAEMLAAAIESAMEQDYQNLEIIISDNASTDSTQTVVKKYLNDPRVLYRRNDSNLGMTANWKKAVEEYARGEWFIILSDDDYFTDAGYISKAVELTGADSSVVLVYAGGELLYSSGEKIKLRIPFEGVVDGKSVFLSRGTVKPMDFTLCNVLFLRETSLKLNPFRNPDNILCDSELFLKLCLIGKVAAIQNSVSVYRAHSENLSWQRNKNIPLLIGCLDYPLESYRSARASGLFSGSELSMFRRRVVMDWINSALAGLVIDHGHNYQAARGIISSRLDGDFPEIIAELDTCVAVYTKKFKRRLIGFIRNRVSSL